MPPESIVPPRRSARPLLSAPLGPLLGLSDRDADRPALIIALFEQGVGNLDRLQSNFGRQVPRRFRVVSLIPRHRGVPSLTSRTTRSLMIRRLAQTSKARLLRSFDTEEIRVREQIVN